MFVGSAQEKSCCIYRVCDRRGIRALAEKDGQFFNNLPLSAVPSVLTATVLPRIQAMSAESGRKELPISGCARELFGDPKLAPKKKVVLVVEDHLNPQLRLNTIQESVSVKPRCHGDASNSRTGLSWIQTTISSRQVGNKNDVQIVSVTCRVSCRYPDS